jgi:predicted DNA binding CopG/RHH family protein
MNEKMSEWLKEHAWKAIQKRALAEGLPYQTLISSLLHKYASGRLKEV